MRLSFKYDVSKISNVQKEIINEHPKMLGYENEEEIRKKLKELLGE